MSLTRQGQGRGQSQGQQGSTGTNTGGDSTTGGKFTTVATGSGTCTGTGSDKTSKQVTHQPSFTDIQNLLKQLETMVEGYEAR